MKDILKRFLSGLSGFIQCLTAFGTFTCCIFFTTVSETTFDVIRHFAVLIIICKIDDFVGGFYYKRSGKLGKGLNSFVENVEKIRILKVSKNQWENDYLIAIGG